MASQQQTNRRIVIDVARSFEDMAKVLAVRSVVYIGELGWTFDQDNDGNDFSATQLLASVDGEPAGSLRIRYFGEFAKPERLAVLPKFRNGRYGSRGVAWELCNYAFSFCQRKGINRFYGHPLEERVGFWTKVRPGLWSPIPGAEINFDQQKIVPLYGEVEPVSDALHAPGIGDSEEAHFQIVRREGDWDRPGQWELALRKGAEQAEAAR